MQDTLDPDSVILPVSAVISADGGERRAYDQVLDKVSKPLMQSSLDLSAFHARNT